MLDVLAQPVVVASSVTALIAVIALITNMWLNTSLMRKRVAADTRLANLRLEHEVNIAKAKTDLEKEAADWKRKSEFAEVLLTDFYDAVERVRNIRSPGAFAFESDSRVGRQEEPETIRSIRDHYYPVIHRVRQNATFFDALHAKRFRAKALFGSNAEEPFDLIWTAVVQVRTAADALMRPDRPLRADVTQNMEDRIWNTSVEHGPDAIEQQTLLGVEKAEGLFGLYLSAGPAAAVNVRN